MFSALRFFACLAGLVSGLGAAAPFQVTIAPTGVERAAQVVTLTLPRELTAGATLRDERGQVVPLQVESDLTAKFIVARQAANQTLTFRLEPGRQPDQGNVQVVEEPSPTRPGNAPGIDAATAPSRIQPKAGRLRVSVGGRPILYYQMDRDAVPRDDIDPKFRRAGYLHPVLTPRGVAVTEDYPPDDPTQHGIAALGPDNARLEFGGIDNTWAGPVHGGFTSWQRWVDHKATNPAELVNESWEFTAYAVPKSLGEINVLDLSISLTNISPGALIYTHGLGLRGPTAWEEPGRRAIFRSPVTPDPRLRWAGLSGLSMDKPAGVAVLFPANGTFGFSEAAAAPTFLAAEPSLPEQLNFTPGVRITLRQRLVVFDGPTDHALLEAIWNGYTIQPVVTLSAP
jgi:hypothetical protein